jgi:ABC-type dipeptide/oligopeptide/nickel transport system permease component
MLRLILKRLLHLIPVLFGVSLLTSLTSSRRATTGDAHDGPSISERR